LIGQIHVTREARLQGYREVTRQLIDRARSLKTPAVNLQELRREMVSAMGDFVGFPPVVVDGFGADATTVALAPDGGELAVGFRNGAVWIGDPLSDSDEPNWRRIRQRYGPSGTQRRQSPRVG
jgi:hypothetical protein